MAIFELKVNAGGKANTSAEKMIQDSQAKKKKLDAEGLEIEKIIGKKYVEAHLTDEVVDENYKEEIEKLRDIVAEQNLLDVKILALSGKRKCTNCGSTVELSSKFCNTCGSKMDEMDITILIGGKVCPKCGEIVEGDSIFCTSCGVSIK